MTSPQEIVQRQRWLSVLANSTDRELVQVWSEFAEKPNYECIKPAEFGLVQIRARAGGTGREFNFSEATVTRCTVRLEGGQVGVGYVSGRRENHAELIAILDGLLQTSKFNQLLESTVIDRLEKNQQAALKKRQKKIRATKVDFLTMVRGES